MKWPLTGGLMIDSPAVLVAGGVGEEERGDEFREEEEST